MKRYITGHMNSADPATAVFLMKRAVVLASFAALSACTNLPNRSAETAPAPAVVSMEEWMNRGDAAVKENDHNKARDAWRSAAKSYPTAKQPWLKLSEDYFNAADYGNAVLAAQEALQRDPKDRVANSVLAVSGLRLTAGSLAALREDGTYPVGSRDEAVSVTRALREALGEPVLVPPPEPPPARKRAARPPVRPTAAGAATDAAPAATTPPASGSPLNKLK